jgi:hypothetical protein
MFLLKGGEAGEAGWRKYFTGVVPHLNNVVEVGCLEST